MMNLMMALGHALWMAFAMFWEILWPLILGFGLSGAVQAVVSKGEMSKLLPNDSPKSLAVACGLGAASSSCSYAAVALARSIFRKGADFTAVMAFELASTNLVAELSIILIVLMGWQFALAEFTGGPVMVAIMAVLFRIFMSKRLVKEAREQADKRLKGKMEGHAEMDMSVELGGSIWQRLISRKGITATSHYFVMDWLAVWKDIVGGLLIAPAHKDDQASGAYDEEGVVQLATRAIKEALPELVVITDVCLCEYTSHGHCGVVREDGQVDNDVTLELLAKTAISQAAAGADAVAPSDMMDGRVGALRKQLDAEGHSETPIVAYSAKFASAFYGPFREAAGSTPAFGDRRSYQMDPANADEAVREALLDVEEGADIVMVKPALPYLDVVRRVKEATRLPVAAYNVSGED